MDRRGRNVGKTEPVEYLLNTRAKQFRRTTCDRSKPTLTIFSCRFGIRNLSANSIAAAAVGIIFSGTLIETTRSSKSNGKNCRCCVCDPIKRVATVAKSHARSYLCVVTHQQQQ